MARRQTPLSRFVAAVLVAALLALSAPARAAETGTEAGGTSKWQYVGRAAVVLGAALILFVVIRAAFSKPDETSRLAAATAKLDRAMEPRPGASGTAPDLDLRLRQVRSRLLVNARVVGSMRPPP